MKIQKILAMILCLTLVFSLASLFIGVYAAEEDVPPQEEEAAEDGAEKEESERGVKAFGSNLKYMGIGMLGIFIVIGIIVIATILVNKIFSGSPKKEN